MPPTALQLQCAHCGESCETHQIVLNDQHFCCEGCKTVYEILHMNDMQTYYQMQEKPGISLKESKNPNRYEYLNEPEIREKLIDFSDGQQTKVSFLIPQMHCSSCIWLLENLHQLTPAVYSSRVNFLKKEAYISFQESILSLADLAKLLASIGYEPTIQLNDLNKKDLPKRNNRTFFYKLGIAGFALGNIMLLSFPEYLGLEKSEGIFVQFFGWLNWILALPVIFYSATDYFRSAWYSLRQKALNIDVPISIGIITLFARSSYEIFMGIDAGYLDSMVGLVFFLLVGRWFQNKTYDSLSFDRDYTSYFPISTLKKTEEGTKSVPVTQLKASDQVVIRNQELIPADAVLMSEEASIDYSFVTGEAEPVRKQKGDLIYAGGRQLGSSIELVLKKEVSQSYLTQLWNDESFQKDDSLKMARLVDTVSKYFTYIILLIGAITGAYWWWAAGAEMAVNVFSAVLIVACPCALALTTPITLGNALRIFGRNKFYLKNTDVVEKMATLSHIVFDKTGTLTKADERTPAFHGSHLKPKQQQQIRSLVQHSTHPVSRWIYQSLPQTENLEAIDFQEITGEGVEGMIDGEWVRLGSAAFILGDEKPKKNAQATRSFVEIDGEVLGYFEMQNQYRTHLAEVMSEMRMHYELSLISGDNDSEKERLLRYFEEEDALHFNQKPEQKLRYIGDLQKDGKRVMMMGDGLNDAGALRKSDVGVAISEDVNHFTPACDAILDAKEFEQMGKFMQFARDSRRMVMFGFALSVFYNLIGLGFAVQGLLAPIVAAILMPISSISAVIFGLASTKLMAKWRKL